MKWIISVYLSFYTLSLERKQNNCSRIFRRASHCHLQGNVQEDGSEMLAENSGTIILFSFNTQCVERQLFLL